MMRRISRVSSEKGASKQELRARSDEVEKDRTRDNSIDVLTYNCERYAKEFDQVKESRPSNQDEQEFDED